MTRRTLTTCAAALALAVVTTVAACSHSSDHDTGPTVPGQPGVTAKPLKQTQWFADTFGTPLIATTNVTPKTVEQAKDVRGTVLPQDKSVVDGPVMWERVRCAALPFSTTDGPTKTRADGVFGGYARTSLGAAMAALQMSSYAATVGNNTAVPQVIAPADRDRLTPQLPQYERGKGLDNPGCLAQQKNIIRPAMWKAEPISDTVTRVQYWWPPRQGDAAGGSLDYTVTWQDGDWYLSEQTATDVLALGGKVPRSAQYTTQPIGWSPW
ncbi:hypothetical protein [Nocardia sp. alder85J]|uniref:hypothetical protein n=1 Tax=Nocardia sp. alder85J TaxID=2862949 RepID=UPI001CD73C62|nr:hypothetical protein [Nocardia sp. alder85J]MCX4099094.1 hypothetical protein [Nocardia sp. alder85J]